MDGRCQHKHKRSIVVFGLSDREKELPVTVLSIQCRDCGQPFEFVGVVEGPGLTLSADRQELRLVLAESLPTMVQ